MTDTALAVAHRDAGTAESVWWFSSRWDQVPSLDLSTIGARDTLYPVSPDIKVATVVERDGCTDRSEGVAARSGDRANGDRWVATDTTRVATSARFLGRATGGFVDYLNVLSESQ